MPEFIINTSEIVTPVDFLEFRFMQLTMLFCNFFLSILLNFYVFWSYMAWRKSDPVRTQASRDLYDWFVDM